MWWCKMLTLLMLTFSICNAVVGPDPCTLEDLLKDVTVDKDNQNLVDDIAQYVVNKVQGAANTIGASGVVDPGKLQEYVTSALGVATGWLTEKTGSLYQKIRDRVSQWWSGMQTRGVYTSEEEVLEEVKRDVLQKLYTKIEEDLRIKISGVTEKEFEKFVIPVIRKTFADLFSFPVKDDEVVF